MKKEMKQQKLLQYLSAHNEHWVMGSQIVYVLQISIRQLRNYVKELNEQYPSLIWSCEQGYWLNPKAYELFTRCDKVAVSVNERRDAILRTLIMKAEGNVFDLERDCHVSVSTIENDLTQLRIRFKAYGLSLERDHERLWIKGSELAKRALCCDHSLAQLQLSLGAAAPDVKAYACLACFLKDHGLEISNASFLSLLTYLQLSQQRAAQGSILKEGIADERLDMTLLMQHFPFLHSLPEQTVFQQFLNAFRLSRKKAHTEEMLQAVHQLQHIFGFDYQKELIDHLIIWYEQELGIRSNIPFGRHVQDSLAITHPLYHKIAQQLHQLLSLAPEAKSMMELTQLLVTFLSVTSSYKVRACLLYTEQPMAEQLFKQLLHHFSNQLQITELLPWQAYAPSNNTADMIICTIDTVLPASYLYLPIAYTEKDMRKARDMIQHKYYKKAGQYLISWFYHQKQVYWIHASQQEDALSQLRALSYMTDAALEELMLEQPSHAFYGELYFPHLISNELASSFFIVITLDTPWMVHKQMLSTFFLAGFASRDHEAYAQWIEQLIWIMSDKHFLKECHDSDHSRQGFVSLLELGARSFAQHKEEIT